MPNSPVCIEGTLESQAACYRLPFDQHDRKAIRVMANALELASLGGTDYTSNIVGLAEDSCPWRKWSRDLRESVETVVDINNATGAGASVPADRDAWLALVKCLRNYSDDDLDAMLGALKCQLGYHETIT